MIDGLKKTRLAATGAADDENIFVSRILWLLRSAGHGEAFCLGQRDVPIGNGVYVGRNIRCGAPADRAVFDTLAVLLRVLALDIYRQPDENRTENVDADIQHMKAGRRAGKGRLKALSDMQQLFRDVRPRCQPHRLAELIKEIHEEQIRQIRQKIFFEFILHRSTLRSLVLTFSPCSCSLCCVLDCSCAFSSLRRMEGAFSQLMFLAENSRKAAVITSASRPLKNTRYRVCSPEVSFFKANPGCTSSPWKKRPGYSDP